MSFETWLAFFVASWLISLSPGAGAITCMTAGMRHGFAQARWNIFGLQLGILFTLAIVAGGLGAVLAASATAFTVVKWLGAAYLIAVGIQQWRAHAAPIDLSASAIPAAGTPRALFVHGFLINSTNPKGILFMLAVLPQFIDPGRPQLVQYLICAATIFCTDLVVMSVYTGFAAQVLRLLRAPHQVRTMNRAFGGMFIAAGVFLATFRRAA